MAKDDKKNQKENVVAKGDLGNGKRYVTLKVSEDSYKHVLENKDIDVKEQGDFKIGQGQVRSRYQPTPYDFTSQYTSKNKPYTQVFDLPDDPHKKIELATELYFKDPIVGTVVDMMVDFSASGFENDCDDKEIKKYYDEWKKEINLKDTVDHILLEYYRSSNVTTYKSDQYAEISINEKSKGGKKGKNTKKTYQFPAGYTVLNPMRVYIEGPLLFNQEIVQLSVMEDLKEVVETGKNLEQILPDEIIKAVRSGNSKVTLNPELVSRITRKKQPYERYARPTLERIFEPILYKQKLRAMDMSTIEGMINQLVTITVGNDDYPATDDDLEAIADLFQTPHKSFEIFWNHTLEVKFHSPEGLDTLDQGKYDQVNEDILKGLGISRVLLDGEGSSFSTAWVSILSLIERLENAREKVSDWLESEYKKIAEENGFDTYPTVRFNRMNLREDNYIRDVLLAMYDRGLLDEENILTETGYDYESILEMKKRNDKNDVYFTPPVQPFQGQGNPSPFTSDGRPTGPNENGYKDRDPSPDQKGEKPKPRKNSDASRATAYYNDLEEEYKSELLSEYNLLMGQTIQEVENNDANVVEEGLLAGIILTLFDSLQGINKNYMNEVYTDTLAHFTDNTTNNIAEKNKKELFQWSESYIYKIANDIKISIASDVRKGASINTAIRRAFETNRYRINLIAEAGIVETRRQSMIKGNKITGKTQATWNAHNDDKTCATCSNLDGESFNIDEVPPRPHSSCRCDLRFD